MQLQTSWNPMGSEIVHLYDSPEFVSCLIPT